jgi:glucan phosphoethanolaminetransferase (alkaline phosphatase superfamily)
VVYDQDRPEWQRRALLALFVAILLVIAYILATAFLPRWWSRTVGDLADRETTWGIWWGLFFGFVFTVVPGFLLRLRLGRRRTWRARAWLLALAALLAAPNLMTLGIVIGLGSGANAGQRTLAHEAPGFRTASLIGALVAAAVVVGVELFLARHRSQRRELTRWRVEDKLRRASDE